MAEKSAVIDLEGAVSDSSDYETGFSSDVHISNTRDDKAEYSDVEDPPVEGSISKGVANYVWEESRQRARKAFSLYANIDILRPYYDVEPKQVSNRLLMSLVPSILKTTGLQPSIPRELYGPTMLVFTLVAMLLLEMKMSSHTVTEGTLMGTAIGTCFGYWLGVSSLTWLTAYICNTRIALIQILHLLGYALFSHCIVVLLTTIFHPSHSHMFFYLLWLVLGGLSSLKMVSVLTARTAGKSQKLIVAGVVVSLHLLFLLYLHFAYHRVVEELSAPLVSGELGGRQDPVELSGLLQKKQHELFGPDALQSALRKDGIPDSRNVDLPRVTLRSGDVVRADLGRSGAGFSRPAEQGVGLSMVSEPVDRAGNLTLIRRLTR